MRLKLRNVALTLLPALVLAAGSPAVIWAQSATTGTTTPPPGASAAQIGAALTGTSPAAATVTLSATAGGVVIAGNVGINFPPGSFAGIVGNVTVTITPSPPSLASVNAGGPSQFSPNGTIFDIDIRDSSGARITTFAQAITIVTKPNPADLTMAQGDFSRLTLAYVIDTDSPAGENPNGYPLGTLVIVAPSDVVADPATGTISASLNFLGSVIGVVTNPVGYVQTLTPNAGEYSSFDPGTSQVFSAQPQFTYLQVTEPQIGGRLLVLDPTTGNYAYVNATDVAPSGPPPGKSAAAVVRGLLSEP